MVIKTWNNDEIRPEKHIYLNKHNTQTQLIYISNDFFFDYPETFSSQIYCDRDGPDIRFSYVVLKIEVAYIFVTYKYQGFSAKPLFRYK